MPPNIHGNSSHNMNGQRAFRVAPSGVRSGLDVRCAGCSVHSVLHVCHSSRGVHGVLDVLRAGCGAWTAPVVCRAGNSVKAEFGSPTLPVSRTPRNGVTMLELLVVLVLMGISAALVAPTLRMPVASALNEHGEKLSAIDAVVADARRLAVRQGRPLRLRIATDGVWVLNAQSDGAVLLNGRISGDLSWLPELGVDALGGCAVGAGVAPPTGARVWDALQCRWRS